MNTFANHFALRLNCVLAEWSDASPTLTPTDIYTFYWIAAQEQPGKVGRFLIDDYLGELRNKYLTIFKPILTDQLIEHQQNGRHNRSQEHSQGSPSFADLNRYMQTTNMSRYDAIWKRLTGHLARLEQTHDSRQIQLLIDRVNSDVRDAGVSVVDKLNNGRNILRALGTCRQANPQQLRSLVHRDYWDLSEAKRRPTIRR